ncbi:MAG: HAD-IIB family hydrolase [Pseudomonadota bacterium]
MRPIQDMTAEQARRIRFVLTDIDDTLTDEGRLPAESYQALQALGQAGLTVVPVTGRPAGWCDMIARFWPVAGVVGENGALAFAYDHETKTLRRLYAASDEERTKNRQKLDRLAHTIVADVPGAAVASDQAYREADLAIDFCEDVPPLDKNAIAKIVAHFTGAGAVAKVSSIHVNGWFGQYDKLTMTRRFFAEILKCDLEQTKDQVIFCGDSPNDSPMFAYFPHGCGVAGVRDFKDEMTAKPAWISQARGASGFVEITQHLLALR